LLNCFGACRSADRQPSFSITWNIRSKLRAASTASAWFGANHSIQILAFIIADVDLIISMQREAPIAGC